MTSLNIMQQLAENQDNQMRLLMDQNTIFAEDFMNAGEGLDIDMPEEQMLGAVPVPGDDCCYLFDYENFGGEAKKVCHYGVAKYEALYESPWNFNDRTQSFSCGKNVKLSMCNHRWDECDTRGSSSGRVKNADIGGLLENKLSSVKIEPYDMKGHGAVNLFRSQHCAGVQASFEYTGSEGNTVYTTWDLAQAGAGDDMISSVQVPSGYVLELYKLDGARDYMQKIVGSHDADGIMQCINLNSSVNDQTSSIIVRPIAQGHAIGYWEGFTATETQKFEYVVGVTQQNGSNAESWQKALIESSMDLGFTFLGGSGANYNIGVSYETGLRSSVSQVATYSSTVKRSTTCTAKSNEGTGLWQWVVRTEDGSIVARDQHTVCKTGSGYNKPPRCPWTACKNGDCTECQSGWTKN